MGSGGVDGRRASLAAVVLMLALLTSAIAGCRPVPQRAAKPPVPPALAGVVQPPATGAYIGLFREPAPFDISAPATRAYVDLFRSSPPFRMTSLAAYASTISPKRPAIVMWYQPWTDGRTQFDAAACASLYGLGIIPMITWEPWDPGSETTPPPGVAQPAWKLSNIVNGAYDPYIRTFARAVKSARGPVMIRFMHEMNGSWYPWSGIENGNTPQDFIAAWRHVHDIFASEGATNVTWVWSINRESAPDTPQNSPAAYYPGDAYVDWVSMSGFNWGPSLRHTSWQSFEFWFSKPLAFLKTIGKPVVISEFGCIEGGGDKGAWLHDAYSRIESQHPEVKAVIYFDKLDVPALGSEDWRIESSANSVGGYQASVASPYYLAAPASTVATWTAAVTNDGHWYLRSLKRIY
jgi:hypothetical protein